MITFKFNEIKTTQVAALFLSKSGGKMNYTKLIKLMYLADRKALSLWERPLTGDSYFAMGNGPVLSNTYDLINYKAMPGGKSYWYKYILKKDYDVSLKGKPKYDELSKRERELIDIIFNEYKKYSYSEMIGICHKVCPEWGHPGSTSIPIQIRDILKAVNKTEREIKIIEDELSNLEFVKTVLSDPQ